MPGRCRSGLGSRSGAATSALAAARIRRSPPEPVRPQATLIDTVGLQQPPSPRGVRGRSRKLRAKSCDLDVFDHAGPRAPAPCSRTAPSGFTSPGGDMADIRRLPTPVAEVWDWQLHGACRGENTSLFFHPDGERGPARARRQTAAKAVC
ncbi:MAG TPA: WhiB family transcriptional regulator, partial [Blastococcus sp.]